MGKKVLKRLRLAVADHVRYTVGTSNAIVEKFGSQLCSPHFLGVFAADYIPRKKILKLDKFIAIVNLGEKGREKRRRRKKLAVGHFVALCGTKQRVQYWDPYALPCLQPHVSELLRDCIRRGRVLEVNKRQIQAFQSVYCGFFCLLYAAYQSRCMDGQAPRFKLHFYKRQANLMKNDEKCMEYLRIFIDQLDGVRS